uniref:Protein kinase domain-containing protein n=1 Tax=Timema douglasi TaxID=61478 RepID=A0A7R8Z2K5_TIMDO|nr:unnamed protein product [Timema douglasi]
MLSGARGGDTWGGQIILAGRRERKKKYAANGAINHPRSRVISRNLPHQEQQPVSLTLSAQQPRSSPWLSWDVLIKKEDSFNKNLGDYIENTIRSPDPWFEQTEDRHTPSLENNPENISTHITNITPKVRQASLYGPILPHKAGTLSNGSEESAIGKSQTYSQGGDTSKLSGSSVVCIVQKKSGGHQLYAMKYMSKNQCAAREALRNVLREVEILTQLDHPFLVNLWFSFQGQPQFLFYHCVLLPNLHNSKSYQARAFKRAGAYHPRAFQRARAYSPRNFKRTRAYRTRALKKERLELTIQGLSREKEPTVQGPSGKQKLSFPESSREQDPPAPGPSREQEPTILRPSRHKYLYCPRAFKRASAYSQRAVKRAIELYFIFAISS